MRKNQTPVLLSVFFFFPFPRPGSERNPQWSPFTLPHPQEFDAGESHGRRCTVGSNTHASTCPHPPQVPVRRLEHPCQDACGFFPFQPCKKGTYTTMGTGGPGSGTRRQVWVLPHWEIHKARAGTLGRRRGSMRERLLGGESGSRHSGLTCFWDMCQCVCVCWAAREALVADQGGGITPYTWVCCQRGEGVPTRRELTR